MNEKQDTLSVIAHELRTSLSATKWVLKMLLDEDLGPITDKQRDFIEKTFSNNDHMIGLVSDMINHRKGDLEEKPYTLKKENITEMIEDVLTGFNAWANQRKIKVEYSHPIEDIEAEIEKNKFGSVVKELIHNALKYTPENGSVSVLLHKNDLLTLEIKDTGIGISPDEKDKLFNKYFRGAKAQMSHPSGSGLGLYLVRHVVEKHNGTITYKKNEGGGSIFEVKIPYSQK